MYIHIYTYTYRDVFRRSRITYLSCELLSIDVDIGRIHVRDSRVAAALPVPVIVRRCLAALASCDKLLLFPFKLDDAVVRLFQNLKRRGQDLLQLGLVTAGGVNVLRR